MLPMLHYHVMNAMFSCTALLLNSSLLVQNSSLEVLVPFTYFRRAPFAKWGLLRGFNFSGSGIGLRSV